MWGRFVVMDLVLAGLNASSAYLNWQIGNSVWTVYVGGGLTVLMIGLACHSYYRWKTT